MSDDQYSCNSAVVPRDDDTIVDTEEEWAGREVENPEIGRLLGELCMSRRVLPTAHTRRSNLTCSESYQPNAVARSHLPECPGDHHHASYQDGVGSVALPDGGRIAPATGSGSQLCSAEKRDEGEEARLAAAQSLESRKFILDKCVEILQKIQKLDCIAKMGDKRSKCRTITEDSQRTFGCCSSDLNQRWGNKPIIVGNFNPETCPHKDNSYPAPTQSWSSCCSEHRRCEAESSPADHGPLEECHSSSKPSHEKPLAEEEESVIIEQIKKIHGMINQSWLGRSDHQHCRCDINERDPSPQKPNGLDDKILENDKKNIEENCKKNDTAPPTRCRGGGQQTSHVDSGCKPKELWAVTKINIYPDDSRTYEVMNVRDKKPRGLPPTSDSIFVMVPPRR